jgi:choline dehydrogenase
MGTKDTPLQSHYDFIVCGAGPAGCVVAGRLAEDLGARVLLVEAGPLIRSAATDASSLWPTNIGTERDWGFRSEPESALSGRAIDYSMGKLVGGGSSINASVWARGHKADWDHIAAASGDPAWGYEAILAIYRRIETYLGDFDARYHGQNGPLAIAPNLRAGGIDPSGLCGSFIAASVDAGIPAFSEQNGALQEAATGVSVTDLCAHDGRRSSVIDGYLAPALAGGNLDLVADTMVTSICLRNRRAVGIELLRNGQASFVEAGCEVIVAGGAIQTPNLLLHSGIGDRQLLRDAGVDCAVHLPGVGRHLQDHPLVSLAWKTPSWSSVSPSAQALAFLDCGGDGTAPDAYLLATEIPARPGTPDGGISWAIGAALLTAESRGRVSIVDSNPHRAPRIHGNYLSAGPDLEILVRALGVAVEIGASNAMKGAASNSLSAPEAGADGIETYIRSKTRSGWHLCGTCKMGDDDHAVVDGRLQVHGVSNLRICDTSVLPNVTRGNTMAPAIAVGERMSEILAAAYR